MKIRNATRVQWDFRWSHNCIIREATTSLKDKDGKKVRVVEMHVEREGSTATIWVELSRDMVDILHKDPSYIAVEKRIQELIEGGIVRDIADAHIHPGGFYFAFELRNGENFRVAAIKRGIRILQSLGLSKEGVERNPEIILLPEVKSVGVREWIPLGEIVREQCAKEMLL